MCSDVVDIARGRMCLLAMRTGMLFIVAPAEANRRLKFERKSDTESARESVSVSGSESE